MVLLRRFVFVLFLMPALGSAQEPVPQWQTLAGGNPAVMDAAWCLTKDDNAEMYKKSMKSGTCGAALARWPWLAQIKEHSVGRAAIQLACGNTDIAGIPVSDITAIDLVRVCHCHNISAQTRITANATTVIAALKRWGGC